MKDSFFIKDRVFDFEDHRLYIETGFDDIHERQSHQLGFSNLARLILGVSPRGGGIGAVLMVVAKT